MARSYHYTNDEIQYIMDNWENMTDEAIANKLERSTESVRRKRDTLGLKKPGGRPSKILQEKHIFENPTEENLSRLSKEKRVEFLKNNFHKFPRYSQVLKELNLEDEVDYYKHKFVEFMESVDTLTINEEDMLHHMIISDILIHRLRTTMKKDIDDWEDGIDGARPPQNLLPELERLENRYMKYHKELNITREQRLKNEREEKITITSLIRSFQDKRVKEEEGRRAAIMDMYKNKAKEDMSKYRYLLGDK